MLPRWFTGVVLLLCLGAVPAHGQAPPQWKFKKGDGFRLEIVSTFKQTMKLLDSKGKPQDKDVKQEIEYTQLLAFKVLDTKDDGSVVLEETLESIAFKNPGGTLTPDEKIKGATLTITLGPKRTVDKVEGLDALLAKLAGEDTKVRDTLKRTLTEDYFKKTAREVFAFLPDKADKKWTRTVDAPLGPLGTLKITNEYKDEGTEKVKDQPVAKITFTSTVTYTKPTKEQSAGAPFHVVNGDLKADGAKGTILFDAATGRLVSSNWALKLKGKMNIAIGDTELVAEVEQAETIKTTLKGAK
jgi:hypothetical protein